MKKVQNILCSSCVNQKKNNCLMMKKTRKETCIIYQCKNYKRKNFKKIGEYKIESYFLFKTLNTYNAENKEKFSTYLQEFQDGDLFY